MFRINKGLRNLILLFAGATITAGCSKLERTNEVNSMNLKAIDSADMDFSVKPGDDFYDYACGNWLKKNPIPDEFSRYGAFEMLAESNAKMLRTLFEEAAKNKGAKKGSEDQKIGDFYASGMDTARIEAEGIKPLQKDLDKIDAIRDFAGVQTELAYLHSIGIRPLFNLYAGQDEKNSNMIICNLYQGGLGLPDRDYYTSDDARSKEIRGEYVKHIEKMLALAGLAADKANNAASRIMAFETKLAKASFTNLQLRDPIKNYNKMPVKELVTLSPAIDWNKYFTAIGLNSLATVNVCQTPFFKEMGKIARETSIDDWKLYLRWNLINETAYFLSSNFVNEHFNFYGTALSGTTKLKDRWKRVLAQTSSSLGEAVGKKYVEKYFPAKAKQRMLELVGNLKKSLKERIQNLAWMSDQTKQKAVEKLQKMNVKIGYPDKWIDYSSLDISRDSYVKNVLAAENFMFRRDIAKIGKPVDRAEWGMTPQTVNAYYSPNMNEIVFPAAILQPPFFYMDGDDAVNYGGIGVVIGHEMTHGFDDQGRQYDAYGNLNDWWTKEDAEKFTGMIQPLIDQFSNYVAIDDIKIDGKLTIGENIADFGGLTVSYNALTKAKNGKEPAKIDGFTADQRFFLSYANVWKNNIRDKELMKRVKEDVHSPGKFRTIGGVANIPAWYKAFDVKPGDKNYIAPEKRANIW